MMATIGILGAGQLGRMLALAGYPLGLRFRFLDPLPDACAGQLAGHVVADYSDQEALKSFVEGLSAVTYEFENVPVAVVRSLDQSVPVYPLPVALEKGQDRFTEKTFFQSLGIPIAEFAEVNSKFELDEAVRKMGLPAVLKTRRLGYDGKGQFVLRTNSDVDFAWTALANPSLILEKFAPFDRELSILGVRGKDGMTAFYPLVENHHREGILRLSLAPAPDLMLELQAKAEGYAQSVMTALGYVGVLAIELFQVGDQLLANEMAPRVHNSGHWTIEGALTSQFENHVRAVAGLPLGSTDVTGVCAMVNLIGSVPEVASILKIDGAHLHLYGKEPRPARKLGHVTLVEKDIELLNEKLEALKELIDK
jgi:5-(carboxyamino)imidazole ribonucleotide synthase